MTANTHKAFGNNTVYIVDEASMISDVYNESEFFRCGSGHLLRDFIKYVNRYTASEVQFLIEEKGFKVDIETIIEKIESSHFKENDEDESK